MILEAALRETDNQVSRADELQANSSCFAYCTFVDDPASAAGICQALLKEEQGRRALLFVRLEAVEAQ